MDLLEECDEGDHVDLLAESRSHASSAPSDSNQQAQQSIETNQGQEHEQAQAQQDQTPTANYAVQTPEPLSTSLFDKLGQLEKQWTDHAASKTKNAGRNTPLLQQSMYHDHSKAPTTPVAQRPSKTFLDDSISPLTMCGETPSVADDVSVSTFGSLGLGSPRNLSKTPEDIKRHYQQQQHQQQADKNQRKEPSIFDRLHRGERRFTSLLKPPAAPSSAKKMLFGNTGNKSPTPTLATKESIRPASSSSRESRITTPQQPSGYASSPMTTTVNSSRSKTIFERLYRRERRNINLWTDPGAKRGQQFKFVTSDGASKTTMISIMGGTNNASSVAASTGASSAGDTPAVPPRKLNFVEHRVIDGAMTGRLALSIQTAWRRHRAEFRFLLRPLVQAWRVTASKEDGVYNSNMILRLKYEVLATITAIRQVDTALLAERLEIEGPEVVSFDHVHDVCFEAWDNDVVVQQKYIIRVECHATLIGLIRKSWSKVKLGKALHLYALERDYHYHTQKLLDEAANLLKRWLLSVAYQRRKETPTPSPTHSTISESSMERQIVTYDSLSWFHDRLRDEALGAKLTRWEVGALIIQSNFRKFLLRRLQKEGMAAHKIQRWYRTALHTSQTRHVLSLIVRVQAWWRGHYFRKQLLSSVNETQLDISISVISAWNAQRLSLERLSLDSQYTLNSDLTISATNRLQAFARKCSARSSFLRVRHAIRQLQALERRNIDRSCYLHTLQSIVRIQAVWRSYRVRTASDQLVAMTVPSLRSAWLSRGDMDHDIASVQLIQAIWRSYRVRTTSDQLAGVTASSLRSAWLSRGDMDHDIASAQLIQAVWRSYMVRAASDQLAAMTSSSLRSAWLSGGDMDHKIASVQLIQSIWRAWCVRRDLAYLREAATIIQLSWLRRKAQREHRATSIHSVGYMVGRQKVMLIQRWWRMIVSRSAFLLLCESANSIERWWRVETMRRKEILARAGAAVMVQSKWRDFRSKSQLLSDSSRTIKVQALGRGFLVRQEMRRCVTSEMNMSVVVLQSFTRMLLRRKGYSVSKRSTILLQSWWRSKWARGSFLLKKEKESMVTMIQCWVRVLQARVRLQKRLDAVILLQSWFLGAKTLRQRVARHNLDHQSTLIIQKHFRAFYPRQCFLGLRRISVRIQSMFRGYLARKGLKMERHHMLARKIQSAWVVFSEQNQARKYSASVVIQAGFRSVFSRLSFLQLRSSSIHLQRFIRGFLAKSRFARHKKAIVTAQRAWKKHFEREKDRARTTAVLQALCRGFLARKQIEMFAESATDIQRIVRSFLSWKRESERRYTTMMLKAVCIQSAWRRFEAQDGFLRIIKAVRRIQTYLRRCLARRSAVLIQSLVRKMQVEQMLNRWKEAAAKIELLYLQKQALLPCYQRTRSALVVQRSYRAWVCRNNLNTLAVCSELIPLRTRQKFCSKLNGRGVSRVWGSRIRTLLADRMEMATLIQRWFRSTWQRCIFLRQKTATMYLQRWWRVHSAISKYKHQRQSVIYLQFVFKRKLLQIKQTRRDLAATDMQRLFRNDEAAKALHAHEELSCCHSAQASAESHPACKVSLPSCGSTAVLVASQYNQEKFYSFKTLIKSPGSINSAQNGSKDSLLCMGHKSQETVAVPSSVSTNSPTLVPSGKCKAVAGVYQTEKDHGYLSAKMVEDALCCF